MPNSCQSHVAYDDDANWLHRNDAYQVQHIAGRKRAVAMPHVRTTTQTISNIITDVAQGIAIQRWYIRGLNNNITIICFPLDLTYAIQCRAPHTAVRD
jgi:hypothetical protein